MQTIDPLFVWVHPPYCYIYIIRICTFLLFVLLQINKRDIDNSVLRGRYSIIKICQNWKKNVATHANKFLIKTWLHSFLLPSTLKTFLAVVNMSNDTLLNITAVITTKL